MIRTKAPGILVLSHLGWDFVWQRPQQILSRLAERFPILYVNEPRLDAGRDAPALDLVADDGRLAAFQPIFPDRPEVLSRWREVYRRLIEQLLVERGWASAGRRPKPCRPLVLWFYTPTPYYLAEELPADLVVYDVMDDLPSFKGAPDDLREREARLLGMAEVAFAGGRSLYEARRGRHPNLHLLPSGVEPNDFGQARQPDTPYAEELAELPPPILGYIGVIDERIDLQLLDELARQRPEWSVAMVGPLAKISAAQLPRRPNIHYFGQQPYERLPHFLKRFDVALMPFALNEATRHISPTKSLEYMAAGKPIVSTAVPDVVASWGDVVRIAQGPADFAAQVACALEENDGARAERNARAEAHLAANAWQAIAGRMAAEIDRALDKNRIGRRYRFSVEADGLRA